MQLLINGPKTRHATHTTKFRVSSLINCSC